MSEAAVSPIVFPQFSRILLTTDFSTYSQRAARFAGIMAELYHATLLIIHVIPSEPLLSVPMEQLPTEMDSLRDTARTHMEEFVNTGMLHRLRPETIIARGPVWQVINSEVESSKIDLIVLGTRARHGFSKLMLGSVAERIFRVASCPVLTVGPEADNTWMVKGRFATILYATDFSSGSIKALPYALSLARTADAKLVLLHVMEGSGVSPLQYEETRNCHDQLNSLVPPAAKTWCEFQTALGSGVPAEMILQTATEQRAGLILMGVHSAETTLAAAHTMGTTAFRVVSHAECPVLTVRGAGAR